MTATLTRPRRLATAVVPRCQAGARKGGWRCPRSAGFGTDHVGSGNCRQHEQEAAAAARAVPAPKVPPALFLEPAYIDGRPYAYTATPVDSSADDYEDDCGSDD